MHSLILCLLTVELTESDERLDSKEKFTHTKLMLQLLIMVRNFLSTLCSFL